VKPRRGAYNPKRRILPAAQWTAAQGDTLASAATYRGNPEHKMRPGDYDLTPPRNPRPGKTLCDADRDFLKADALDLLRKGLARGMVSRQRRNEWPQNVWAVSDTGEAFEAQLENQDTGVYHGYPMPIDDDFRSEVIEQWGIREP
jgi:hypothetical protein